MSQHARIERMVDAEPPRRNRSVRTDPGTVAEVTFESSPSGLIVGNDRDGQPVVIPLFTDDPMEIVLVGSLGFAKMVAFRALALGAQVWVETKRHEAWDTFVRTSAGTTGTIHIVHDFPAVSFASEDLPVLVVIDSEASIAEEEQLGRPWVTVLTTYGQLTQWNVGDLPQADMVMLQPLTRGEAALASNALRLQNATDVLSALPPDVVTLVQDGKLQAARIAPTSVETWMVGDVTRTMRERTGRP